MAFTDWLANSDNKVIEIRKGQSPLYSTLNVSLSYTKAITLALQYQIKKNGLPFFPMSEIVLAIYPESSEQIVSQKIELPFLEFDKGETYTFRYRYVFGNMDSGGLSPASTITESVSLNDNVIYQNNPLFTTGGIENQFTYTNAQELPNRININLAFNIV